MVQCPCAETAVPQGVLCNKQLCQSFIERPQCLAQRGSLRGEFARGWWRWPLVTLMSQMALQRGRMARCARLLLASFAIDARSSLTLSSASGGWSCHPNHSIKCQTITMSFLSLTRATIELTLSHKFVLQRRAQCCQVAPNQNETGHLYCAKP